jgi:hypothetical protein
MSADVHEKPMDIAFAHLIASSWTSANTFRRSLKHLHIDICPYFDANGQTAYTQRGFIFLPALCFGSRF